MRQHTGGEFREIPRHFGIVDSSTARMTSIQVVAPLMLPPRHSDAFETLGESSQLLPRVLISSIEIIGSSR